MKLEFAPLTPERWPDLEKLFGERGACGGCWCMWWRLRQSEYKKQRGEGNRRGFRALVKKGPPPGILAYEAAEPVGWCSIGPRPSFPRMARSRVLKPVDDQAVWSVTCLFIRKMHRGKGVSTELLKQAAALPPETARALSRVIRWSRARAAFPTPSPGSASPPPSAPPASAKCCAARRCGRSCGSKWRRLQPASACAPAEGRFFLARSPRCGKGDCCHAEVPRRS